MSALPEEELLRACIRWSLGLESAAQVRERAGQLPEWVAFLNTVQEQGLAPLAADCLLTCGVVLPAMPGTTALTLRNTLTESARRVLLFTHELKHLLDALEAADISVMVLKGPSLAHLFYPEPAHRLFFDLDLLVRREDASAAQAVLAREGYTEPGDEHFHRAASAFPADAVETHLENREKRIAADLHWGLLPPWFPARVPRGFRERAQHVCMDGRAVQTLGRTDYVLYLCLHGAKHEWSGPGWLVDLCHLLQASPGLDYDGLKEIARQNNAEGMLWFGLLAANQLAEGGIPALARAVANAAAKAPQRVILLTKQPNREYLAWKLSDSRRAAARGLARLTVMPNAADWTSLRIPWRGFFFLYYPWRLLRLARKYLTPRRAG